MTIATPDLDRARRLAGGGAGSPVHADERRRRLWPHRALTRTWSRALAATLSTLRPKGAEVFRFPPVVSRTLIEKSGYLKSFPHLLGCVCALGTDVKRVTDAVARYEAGGNWTDSAEPSELVLAPAACYPDLSDRGAARRGRRVG